MTTLKDMVDWYRGNQTQTSQAIFRTGRVRTVWIGGVLIFGGTMFLVTTVSDFIFRPHKFNGIWEVGWLLCLCYCGGSSAMFLVCFYGDEQCGDGPNNGPFHCGGIDSVGCFLNSVKPPTCKGMDNTGDVVGGAGAALGPIAISGIA